YDSLLGLVLEKRPDLPPLGADPRKWDALPAACHSLDEAGRIHASRGFRKKRQRSRQLTPLKPETCESLCCSSRAGKRKPDRDFTAIRRLVRADVSSTPIAARACERFAVAASA